MRTLFVHHMGRPETIALEVTVPEALQLWELLDIVRYGLLPKNPTLIDQSRIVSEDLRGIINAAQIAAVPVPVKTS